MIEVSKLKFLRIANLMKECLLSYHCVSGCNFTIMHELYSEMYNEITLKRGKAPERILVSLDVFNFICSEIHDVLKNPIWDFSLEERTVSSYFKEVSVTKCYFELIPCFDFIAFYSDRKENEPMACFGVIYVRL
jgi:hypothetical protein